MQPESETYLAVAAAHASAVAASAGLLLLLAVVVGAAVWIARLTVRVVVPRARALRDRVVRAAAGRPGLWPRAVRVFLDPREPGSQALAMGLVLLLASMWIFFGIVEDVVSRDPLVVADASVFDFLQHLRTHAADRVMVGITQMGSVGVMLPLVVVVALWLAAHRCWRTAGYWVATVASSEALVQVMKYTLGRHRPLALYEGLEQFSFPSGHATISAVVLPYLGFLATRGQPARWRVFIAAAAAVYVALVGFSRLYLGAHWLSDVLGGFSFGLAVVAVSAMVYTHHAVGEAVHAKGLALVSGITLAVAGAVWGAWHLGADMKRYAVAPPADAVPLADWAVGGWRSLPARRREFAGEVREPFTVQVACAEPALRETLREAGWIPGPALGADSLLQMTLPHRVAARLPLLPAYDGGRASAIELARAAPAASARDVLRLWKSASASPQGQPIWYGAFSRETIRPNGGILRDTPLAAGELDAGLEAAGWKRVATHAAPGERAPELWRCE
jgi:undecaprenyl-diphosphatase